MSEELRDGAILGDRYRLAERIGSGGMSSVWGALDLQLDREVAIKVISETLTLDGAFMARFRREARTAASFAHPNVVRVYDFEGDGRRPFLVMERVRGGTLADAGAAGRVRDPERLTVQILAALDHIHRAGVIHRDVKPANVLLDDEGNAVLTDFGIAHSAEATRYTQTGAVIGTLRYMAPELHEGGEPSPRSDLYSLGVLIRESLTPLSPGLERLSAALTAADPRRRPESAAAARWLLERAGSAPAAADREATAPTERIPAGGGGNRRLIIGGLALAVIAGVSAAAVLGQAGSDQPSGDAAAAPGAVLTTTTTTTSTAEATATTAPLTTTDSAAPTTPTEADCVALETEKQALEEEKKATEEQLKEDPDAKKAAADDYKLRIDAINEEIKACKEAAKGAG